MSPPAPKRPWYKKKRFLIPLIFILVIVVIAVASPKGSGSGADTAAGATSKSPAEKSPGQTDADKSTAKKTTPKADPTDPGLGAKVRDGKFEFTVQKITVAHSIGEDPLGTTAQGKFLMVTVKVENIGTKSQTFLGDAQKLFDTAGRQFSADGTAAIYLTDSKSFIEPINPGNSLTGVVVFDVPKKVKPAKIELHDSLFSGGVTVALD